ncbi:MAG: SRPBCC family protein [Chthoniobacteraceae bacterium]
MIEQINPSTADREIVISREFSAPVALVWAAMTNPQQVAQWWGPNGFSTTIEVMDFREGGHWKHVMRGPDGVEYPNHSVFREIVEHERVTYTHGGHREGGPGVSFTANWIFEKLEEKKTRLTLKMVFPSAENRDFVVKEFGAIEGGKQTLGRLAEHLAKGQGASGEFVLTRVFAAPRELVWAAWTSAEHLAKWFCPPAFTLRIDKLDLTPGGLYHYAMRTPDGHEMWGKWVFREIIAPEKLVVVVSFSDAQGGFTRHPMSATWPLEKLSSITLEEHEGKTLFTLRSSALNATAEEQQTFDADHDSMRQGWKGSLDALDRYLATQTKS